MGSFVFQKGEADGGEAAGAKDATFRSRAAPRQSNCQPPCRRPTKPPPAPPRARRCRVSIALFNLSRAMDVIIGGVVHDMHIRMTSHHLNDGIKTGFCIDLSVAWQLALVDCATGTDCHGKGMYVCHASFRPRLSGGTCRVTLHKIASKCYVCHDICFPPLSLVVSAHFPYQSDVLALSA